jgi:hypothetical protein
LINRAYIISIIIALINTIGSLKKKITMDLYAVNAHGRQGVGKKNERKEIDDAENFKTKQSINAFMWVG